MDWFAALVSGVLSGHKMDRGFAIPVWVAIYAGAVMAVLFVIDKGMDVAIKFHAHFMH